VARYPTEAAFDRWAWKELLGLSPEAEVFGIDRLPPMPGHVRDLVGTKKAKEFWPVIKTGRTHLQDATPIRLGQEFQGYAGQVERSLTRLDAARRDLEEVALGGNALTRAGQSGTCDEMLANAAAMASAVHAVIEAGWRVVIVHGNGPQVGNLALQQEGTAMVPAQPLPLLSAMTQGLLGSLLARAIDLLRRKTRLDRKHEELGRVLAVEQEMFWGDVQDERSAYFVAVSRARTLLCLTVCDERPRSSEAGWHWAVASVL